MNDKELYKQKYQAQIDQWKAEVEKLRAKASGAKADAQLEINKLVSDLEDKVHAANAKMGELSGASEDAWDSVKKSVESSWNSMKASFHEAVSKIKD